VLYQLSYIGLNQLSAISRQLSAPGARPNYSCCSEACPRRSPCQLRQEEIAVRAASKPKKVNVAVRNRISTSKPSNVSRIGSFDKVSQLSSPNTAKATIARPNFFPILNRNL
jgi:hypothetical protein